MPTLNAYVDGSGYYTKTNLRGRVATLQLAPAAARRLLAAGVKRGGEFPSGVLLAMLRDGEASVVGGMGGQRGAQARLPLAGEDEAVGAVEEPRCEELGTSLDLHLVALEERSGAGRRARILGAEARQAVRPVTVLSVPLAALGRASLERLVEAGKVPLRGGAVGRLRRWLVERSEEAWRTLERHKTPRQPGLRLR